MENMHSLRCDPIGYFSCSATEKYMARRQPACSPQNEGKITLLAGKGYEQALEDLAGFSHIWIIFWFDRNANWNPKVLTPRGGTKKGVFATRSPHRPNPIGLSCVELKGIEGLSLSLGKSDLLDGTAILDIKPYLPYCDRILEAKEGWTAGAAPPQAYQLVYEDIAAQQEAYISAHSTFFSKVSLKEVLDIRLAENPLPFPGHRIKALENGRYEIAIKTWRIVYIIEGYTVTILRCYSGYDKETLQGKKNSRWDDVPMHVEFIKIFS